MKELDKVFDLNIEPALQGTPEWHQERLKRLTASRFGDMMKEGKGEERFGMLAKKYVYEKIAEHLSGTPHIISAKPMEWGTDHEEEARNLYIEIKKVEVVQCGFLSYEEIAGGSPDGLVGENGIIEIKCPFNPANHVATLITNEVTDNHLFQCQGNLMITDRKWCDYISYDPRINEEKLRLHVIRINRNDQVIEAIQERIKEVSEYIDNLLMELA